MAIRSDIFIKSIVVLSQLMFLVACDSVTSTTASTPSGRWMDRKIYFARPDEFNPSRNNAFQKDRVKEALRDFEQNTLLGEGYFSFEEIEEGALDVSVESGAVQDEKSFILIWPDAVFDDYIVNVINGQTPDPNAVAIINSSNKRKFFIILRASCITYSVTSSCPNIGVDGFKALIWRQLGFLLGLKSKDCTLYPTDIMCAESPSKLQYSDSSKLKLSNAANNLLESILLNENYYP